MYFNVYAAVLITQFNLGEFSGGEKVFSLTAITKPTTSFLITQLVSFPIIHELLQNEFPPFENDCVTVLVQLPQ